MEELLSHVSIRLTMTSWKMFLFSFLMLFSIRLYRKWHRAYSFHYSKYKWIVCVYIYNVILISYTSLLQIYYWICETILSIYIYYILCVGLISLSAKRKVLVLSFSFFLLFFFLFRVSLISLIAAVYHLAAATLSHYPINK